MAKNNNLGDFIKGLADKFRSKLGTTDKINPQDFEGKVDEVYNKGKQEEYDTFWDNYQSNGNRTVYEFAFAREGWTEENFKPKYDIMADMQYSSNIFVYSRTNGSLKKILSDCGVSLTFHNSGSANGVSRAFMGSLFTELPELDFSEANGNDTLHRTFNSCRLLQTIEKIIMPTECKGYGLYIFLQCYVLQNINFEGTIKYSLDFQDCPLSADSVYNILNHLDTTAYSGTRTITLKTTSKTAYNDKYGDWDERVAQLTSSGNWTFTLT